MTKNFYLWLLQIIGLLGLLAFCLWLSLRPKSPSYTVVEFSMPAFSNHSSSSPVGNQEDRSLNCALEIKNPSKDSSIYFEDILVTFIYRHDTIGKNRIPAFRLDKDKTTLVANHVDASPQIWSALVKEISSNATIDLKLGLVTGFRYRTYGVKSKHHGVNKQASLKIGSDGKISGKKQKVKLTNVSKKFELRAAKFH